MTWDRSNKQTNQTKLISTLRLLIPRLRLLQKKDTASSVAQRRELAHLLDEGREASARIRVENVITTDIGVEAMEMVELYCELLLARANVLDQLAFGEKGAELRREGAVHRIHHAAGSSESRSVSVKTGGSPGRRDKSDQAQARGRGLFGFSFFGGGGGMESPKEQLEGNDTPVEEDQQYEAEEGSENEHKRGRDSLEENDEKPYYLDSAIDEAAIAIFYAWPRFPHEVRELTMLRTLLVERYGKEFMHIASENRADIKVAPRLVKRLQVRAPTKELVESYLLEIAKAYGVEWPKGSSQSTGHDSSDSGAGDSGDIAVTNADQDDGLNLLPSTPKQHRNQNELSKATPPTEIGEGKSPVSVSPPAARTDNLHPQVKLPQVMATATRDAGGEAKGNNSSAGGNRIPEVDELTKRFAALRR